MNCGNNTVSFKITTMDSNGSDLDLIMHNPTQSLKEVGF